MSKPSIDTVLNEERVFPPPADFQKNARLKSLAEYRELYARSIRDPEGFWSGIAAEFVWHKPFRHVLDYSFDKDLFIRWFAGGVTNLCVNALDRHLPRLADKTAILFIPNSGPSQQISYAELGARVERFASALKGLGLKRGERVAIYMPMVPEAAVAMLACARVGLVHNVVFGGFAAQSLKDRIHDSEARVLITANELLRGDKVIALKQIADEALEMAAAEGHAVAKCVVLKRTETACAMHPGRDVWWHEIVEKAAPRCTPEWMEAEEPLFMLYTSGSTGKPKGVLHTTAGFMIYVATTFKYLFDVRDQDIYFCTADVGWVTGHSYLVYGPLLNGATTVIFEGIPTHPRPDRLWDIVEQEKITILYTAPTALRALQREGNDWPNRHDLSSLRLLGTVGEPINPEAWMWYHEVIGKGRCPIVDTWWQTETGGILISPFPGATPTKPGAATVPFFGVVPRVVREDGTPCEKNEGGYLLIERPWPGMMRTVYKNHRGFFEQYFSRFPGRYFTGDSARMDKGGDFWLMGRIDDVVKVSGHRLGTAEIESALVAHPAVTEAAVVGFPHQIKGEGIYAFVTLTHDTAKSDGLRRELQEYVKKEIGALARPEVIHFADALPKTRSGKIMRRILRKIAAGDTQDLGDTTTLADPGVVEKLLSTK